MRLTRDDQNVAKIHKRSGVDMFCSVINRSPQNKSTYVGEGKICASTVPTPSRLRPLTQKRREKIACLPPGLGRSTNKQIRANASLIFPAAFKSSFALSGKLLEASRHI